MIAKHDTSIKDLKQNLLDMEEMLKTAQKKNSDLEKRAEALQKQAEQAKVRITLMQVTEINFLFQLIVLSSFNPTPLW